MLKIKITVRASGDHTVRVPIVAAGAAVLTSVSGHNLETIKSLSLDSMSPDAFAAWLNSIESVAVRHLTMLTGRPHDSRRFGDRARLLHTLKKRGSVTYELVAFDADDISDLADVVGEI